MSREKRNDYRPVLDHKKNVFTFTVFLAHKIHMSLPLDTMALLPTQPEIRHIDVAVERAVRQCLESQDEQGAWEILPDPRVFETALGALALAQVDRDHAGLATVRARNWVRDALPQRHHPVAYFIESTLKDLVLNTSDSVDMMNSMFAGDVLSSRARLLYALALHAGKKVLARQNEEEFRVTLGKDLQKAVEEKLKQWTMVDLYSARILVEARHDQPEVIREAVQYLVAVQAADGSFCANPVSTFIALMALGVAAPESEACRRCHAFVVSAQHSDGTWRFCSSDIWDTSLMVRGFRQHPVFARHALGRAIRFLQVWQNADGGWPFRRGVESDNDTTGSVLLTLKGIAPSKRAVARACGHLAGNQMSNGLWRTWHYRSDPPVEDTMAHIIGGLESHPVQHNISLDAAKRWLEERFNETGCWKASWYYSIPYAIVEVTRALGPSYPSVQKAIEHLEATQNPDGGWGQELGTPSVPSATGLAIAALIDHRPADCKAILRGLTYLLATQRHDGTWPGAPEMFGPRPLISHYQTHTQAFVAMGLIPAWDKLRRLQ